MDEGLGPKVKAYRQRLELPYEETQGGDFEVTYESSGEPLTLVVRWDDRCLWVVAPKLVQIPKRSKLLVFQRILEIQWRTFEPKFEWDSCDGELRAAWYWPVQGGLPTFDQFRSTLLNSCEASLKHRSELQKLARDVGTSLAGTPGERLLAAADLSALGRDLVELAQRARCDRGRRCDLLSNTGTGASARQQSPQEYRTMWLQGRA